MVLNCALSDALTTEDTEKNQKENYVNCHGPIYLFFSVSSVVNCNLGFSDQFQLAKEVRNLDRGVLVRVRAVRGILSH